MNLLGAEFIAKDLALSLSILFAALFLLSLKLKKKKSITLDDFKGDKE